MSGRFDWGKVADIDLAALQGRGNEKVEKVSNMFIMVNSYLSTLHMTISYTSLSSNHQLCSWF